ncbi:MAG: quinoprotein dehydrogenase-associated SoxYZ-like carrier [Kiloniellales bacterium]|nr:quinoprotein dehydrogenase-associated SoxYZ-like carrier [Kiloniellales bacterium]
MPPARRSAVWARGFAPAAAIALALSAAPALAAGEEDDPWPDLRETLFGERPIAGGAGVVGLEAPYRAYDAAIVPVTIAAEIPQTAERYIKTLTLIVDKNPAPVAAVFNLTPEMGTATISTRIRVNEYTNVRVIAETSDGALHMVEKFVKAAGGCSAPALKDMAAAEARIGKMKLKQSRPGEPEQPQEVQLLVSHPNYTGFQMNQLTRHYIPAHFVQDIKVSYAGQTLMTVEGAISLSEDPSIHFSFLPRQGSEELSVEVRDTDGAVFTRSWPIGTAGDS